MPRDTLDFDSKVRVAELKKEYKKRKPSITRFAKALEKDITRLLREEGIEAQQIKPRVKTFDSFYDKIGRKWYRNPFEETDDLCGLRIVSFLRSDLGRIGSL